MTGLPEGFHKDFTGVIFYSGEGCIHCDVLEYHLKETGWEKYFTKVMVKKDFPHLIPRLEYYENGKRYDVITGYGDGQNGELKKIVMTHAVWRKKK